MDDWRFHIKGRMPKPGEVVLYVKGKRFELMGTKAEGGEGGMKLRAIDRDRVRVYMNGAVFERVPELSDRGNGE